MISFDHVVAHNLLNVLSDSSNELRGQGIRRRELAEDIMAEFAGPYAVTCSTNLNIENTDRVRLVRVIEDLHDDVAISIQQAKAERERLEAIEEWKRQQSLLSEVSFPNRPVCLIQPSIYPVRPAGVNAHFDVLPRTYSGSGNSRVSCANVAVLRHFASECDILDVRLVNDQRRLYRALALFSSRCSWAVNGPLDIADGYENYLTENYRVSRWIEAIAEAFERAGSQVVDNLHVVVQFVGKNPVGEENSSVGSTSYDVVGNVLDNSFSVAEAVGVSVATGLSRFAPRGENGRFIKQASSLIGRGWQAFKNPSWVAKPGKAAMVHKLTTTTKRIGHAGIIFGFADGAIRQWTHDAKDSQLSTWNRIQRAAQSSVAIGLSNWGGAASGAKIGSLIGAAAGPVGTIIGGVIGGFVGGWLGSEFSEHVVDKGLNNG